MDLLSQLQKFGNVKAGLPPAFSQIMPSTLAITGSVLTNAGVGGLILRAYTEIGRLPNSASILPDAFGGKPLATTLINSVAFNLASFSGQNSNYSLRISGYIQCSVSNNYIFRVISDDAVRLFIDETRIIDSWTFAGGIPVTSTGSCFMCAGQYYPILIEHSATGGSQQLTVQSSSDGITFKTLTHAIDGSNFSMAFDSSEFGGVRAGSLRVGGQTIFNGSIAAQATRKALLLVNPPYLGTIAALSSNLAGPFAIAFWVKHTASSGIQTFVSFGGNRHIQINQFNQLIIAPSNGAAPSVSSTILATNVPNHVSCFLNSSNQFALYVNGALDSAYNGSYTASTLPAIFSDSLAIGGISSSTAATSSNLANVNTVIADLSIWNVAAFGTIDALKIYNSGRRYDVSSDVSLDNTSLPNLYLSYGFDTDNGKTRFTDSSPWHRNLIFSSGSTVSAVPAIIVNSDAFSVISNKIHTLNNVAIGSPNTLAPLTVVGSSNSLYNGALVVVKSIGSNANSAISVTAGVGASSPGGNSFIVFDQKDISGWSFGQDVSDAAKLKICNNSSFLTSSPYLTIDTSGRVGIGLSSPAFNLDIAGNINFSGSLYQGGAAYISSQWTTSGQNIFFGSSVANVGINTSNPLVSLDVVGSGRFTGSLSVAALTGTLINSTNILASKIGLGVAGVGQMLDVKGSSSWGQARFIPQVDNSEAALSFYRYSNLSQAAAGDTWILGHAAAGAAPGFFGLGCFGPNGTVSAINIASTGFVGVAGKINPAFALDVLGNVNFSGNLFQGGVQYVGSQWTSAGTNLFYNAGAVGIGLSNPAFTLDISGSSRISGSLTTNLVAASSLNVFGTISGTSLSLSGTFTTSGIIANNVYGSLLGRFYDESGVYNNIGSLTAGSPLPSAFITRPLIDNQLSLLSYNNATIGSLSANYSLRVAGYIQPPATGTYLFRVTGQEGYALYIAGQKLVNKWTFSGSVTSMIGTLTMYSRMWSPISVEHVCAASGQRLLVEVSPSNGTFVSLTHGTLSSSFQFAYDFKEVSAVSFGSIYVNGTSDFSDTATFENGISLPNTSYFSGNSSELNNDALFLKSSGMNYLNVAGSLTIGGSSNLIGSLKVGTGNASWYLGTISGATNGAFLQNSSFPASTTNSFAVYQDNSSVTSPATLINAPANGQIGLQINNTTSLLVNSAGQVGINNSSPKVSLDVIGSANISASLTVSSISASSLSTTFSSFTNAFTSTLSVGTILNFSAGGSIGTNLTLSGTLLAPSASISSLVFGTCSGNFGSLSKAYVSSLTASSIVASSLSTTFSSFTNAFASTLSVGTILNFSNGGSLGTNLSLSGTFLAPSASISSLVSGTCSAVFASLSQAYVSTLSAASGSVGSLIVSSNSITSALPLIVNGASLGSVAGNQTLVANLSGYVGNNLQLQCLLNRAVAGSSWYSSSFRLQTVVDATPMTYLDFNTGGASNAIATNGSWNVAGSSTSAYLSTNLVAASLSDPVIDFSSGRDFVLRKLGNARILAELNIGTAFGTGSGTLSTVWTGQPASYYGTIVNQSFFPGFANGAIRIVGGGGYISTSSLFDKGSITGQLSGPNPKIRLCVLVYYPTVNQTTPSLGITLGSTTSSFPASTFGALAWQFVSMDVSTEFSNFQTGQLSLSFTANTADNTNFMYIPWFAIVQDSYAGSVMTLGGAMSLTGGVTFTNTLSALTTRSNFLAISPTSSGSFFSSMNSTMTSGSQIFQIFGSSTAVNFGAAYLNYFAGSSLTATSRWGLYGANLDALTCAAAGTICNIGINNSSPSYNLDIAGTCRVTSSLMTNGNNTNFVQLQGGTGTSSEIKFVGSGYAHYSISNNAGTFVISNTSNNTALGTPGNPIIAIAGNGQVYGNVGINTTTPAFQLDVSGSSRTSGFSYMGSSVGIQVYSMGVTMGGSNTVNTYTIPSAITGSKVISLTGMMYMANNLTYPIGYTADPNYSARVWLTGNTLNVNNLGNSSANYPGTVTLLVSS